MECISFSAIRSVIEKHNRALLPPIPSNNERSGYGTLKVSKVASLFEVLHTLYDPVEVVERESPIAMELVGQVYKNKYIFFILVEQGQTFDNHN